MSQSEKLPYLSSEERLQAYQKIVNGCAHIWSKNELRVDNALALLSDLIPLTVKDPYFLAHLASYAMTKTQNKDLQVFATFVSALSTANGSPFSPGSKYKKPNLRYVAGAAVHHTNMDPKMAGRVLQLANLKFAISNYLNESRHFPTALRTALKKYLLYREQNPEMLRGIKRAGLGKVLRKIYRGLRMPRNEISASILHWPLRGQKVEFEESVYKDFDKLDDLQIAEKIRKEKLAPLGVLGALPRLMSPVIAVALLERCTGNQAVILRKTFEDAGILQDKEVMDLYKKKIAEAKTALDRVANISATASKEVKEALVEARSESRKKETTGLGKLFLHLDFSGSMDQIRKFAVERGAIIAECVNNPQENFKWGWFDTIGVELELPEEFVQDAFAAKLFGAAGGGGTDCFSLYPNARQWGADVDVFISDQDQTVGDLSLKIADYHRKNPEATKPRVCVIVYFENGMHAKAIERAYEENGVPVVTIKPDTLTESALVVEAVKTALLGPSAVIDEIMETELLKLPEYYFSL